ncbi:excinuclease ABC subunit UvrC [Nitratireductor indicus]|uniref:UvrABC system protein C n=1 Tax=Nitratireductor indicus C115 TaxID=1231190 RepID=K2N5Y5_9HYPH|nr:excinuclease ABC subunit UvrC [Nitratireductor indicus]EKF42883.1 excinuclease ABC subunit C [Nitratireductor indicus C115]MDS1134752.1 excinuclease ABC subunit UvrC [Nitratireductor indicus]SFQ41735.1 Excinuclease ABC subunit C [Nitratireductor indicus]
MSDTTDIELSTPAGNALDWYAGDAPTGVVGIEVIQAAVKRLPNAPGVYRMMNAEGDVLYVGKARNLKKRVTNYAQGRGHTNRIGRMVRETASMEFVVTRTETEALLLEANLIKRLRPRFNVLLRDDKSFPYILLTGDHAAPGIFKHRGARSRKGDYFGPFASAGAVGRTINSLQRAFLLRTCTDSVFESRTRPCLLYQIKRCSGPCTGEISATDYMELVNEAKAFLSGRSSKVKAHIAEAMQEASSALDFERAAVYRDRLSALSHVQSHQGINPQGVEEADVIAIHQEGGQNCIQVFFFRTGQNWGNRAYFPKADPALGSAEVLGAFLAQFYDDKPCPPLLLLSHEVEEQELLAEALSTRAGRKVQVLVPQRGEKKDLTEHALQNAREALGRRLAETSSQARLMEGFAETFGLDSAPRRIEVYDNSHIMGTNAVGGMIVAGMEGFAKNQYRKFNIRSTDITPGDDYGMMREVMQRRFSRLLKENGLPDDSAGAAEADDAGHRADMPAWPDVILIDGGQGQLAAASLILDELGITDRVTAIGVAKGVDRDAGRERFFMAGRNSFTLPPRDPVLYFVQRLRDEAHRFAIGSHRARRKKEMVKNPLDEIAGIGPGRKRALLHHFGTAKAVSRAAMEDLTAVEGISEAIARQIYNHFHEKG